MEAVFSKRAMTALLAETREKITTETGGVFLGRYLSGVWYVVETIDPGPGSIFRTAYFEYDQAYINHLINKVSRLYKNQLDLIGLWHRHPGSLDTFSMTDDGTNTKYAQLSEHGAISGLVNIDPKFRLTVYHAAFPLTYTRISYSVDDVRIPASVAELIDPHIYAEKLGDIQALEAGKIRQPSAFRLGGLPQKNILAAIHDDLKKRTLSDVVPMELKGFTGELPIERILEALEPDLGFFEANGVDYSINIGERGLLCLTLRDKNDTMQLFFGMDQQSRILFSYNEITYMYRVGLLGAASKEKSRRWKL